MYKKDSKRPRIVIISKKSNKMLKALKKIKIIFPYLWNKHSNILKLTNIVL